MTILIIQFVAYVFSLTITYFLGSLFTNKINFNNKYEKIFCNSLLGIVIIVIVASLIRTNLITINVFLLILVMILFVNNRNNITFKVKFRSIIELFDPLIISTLVIVFICAVLKIYDLQNFEFNSSFYNWHDNLVMSELSTSVFESGNENSYGFSNLLYPEMLKGVQPYHYFEHWYNGFFSYLFKNPSLLSLFLVTTPTFFYVGLVGLFSLLKSHNIFTLILIFFISCVTGFYFIFYENYEVLDYYSGITTTSLFGSQKYKHYYLFLIMAVIFYKKNKIIEMFLSIVCLPIISIGTAPAVLPAVIISVISLYSFKIIDRKICFRVVLYTSIISILIFLFYITFTVKGNNNHLSDFLLFNNKELNYFKYIFWNTVERMIKVIVFYFPFLLIIIIYLLKNRILILKNVPLILLVISILFLLITGSICSSVMYKTPDSNQLFYNVLPIVNVIFIVFFIGLFNNKKYEYTVYFLIIIIFSSIFCVKFFDNKNKPWDYKYSNEFKSSVNRKILTTHGNILYCRNKKEIKTIIGETYMKPLGFLKLSTYKPINISCMNKLLDYKDNEWNEYFTHLHEFLIHSNNSGKSIISFCEKYNYKYLITFNNETPKDLMPFCKDSIYDQSTKQNLFELDFTP